MKTATVQLNGKTYDAITGAFITDGPGPQPKAAVVPVKKTVPVKSVAAPAEVVATRSSTPVAVKIEQPSATTHHPHHGRAAAPHAKRAPQSSVTLMRRAVKKPDASLKKSLRVQTPLAKTGEQILVKKISINEVHPGRLQRAQTVERHNQVKHYAHSPSLTPNMRVTHVPVRIAPEDPKPEEVAAPAPKPSNDPEDIFERAVANANHYVDVHARHSQFKKKARLHIASLAAGSFAILLIAGFAAYQNLPGVQLSVAGVQAGVATAAPDFAASGFAYSGVSAHDGKRVIGFTNDTGQYQLTQQSTNWSSEDMIRQVSSVTASGEPTYSTVSAGDETVYRLSNTQATWVKNGVWYQVTGTSVLNDSQLVSLVQNS